MTEDIKANILENVSLYGTGNFSYEFVTGMLVNLLARCLHALQLAFDLA